MHRSILRKNIQLKHFTFTETFNVTHYLLYTNGFHCLYLESRMHLIIVCRYRYQIFCRVFCQTFVSWYITKQCRLSKLVYRSWLFDLFCGHNAYEPYSQSRIRLDHFFSCLFSDWLNNMNRLSWRFGVIMHIIFHITIVWIFLRLFLLNIFH